MITDINTEPYLAFKIKRDDNGVIENCSLVQGRGCLIGSENLAFPANPDPSVVAGRWHDTRNKI